MGDPEGVAGEQLKQTCKLTGARWAVWSRHQGSEWVFGPNSGLTRLRQDVLTRQFADASFLAWLAGSVNSNRTRSRTLGPAGQGLDTERLYVFSNPATRGALLVGAGMLSKEQQAFFRVLALGDPFAASAQLEPPEALAPPQGITLGSIFPPDSGPEVAYDPEAVLNWVLDVVTRQLSCQAAYLAIRSGDVFRVVATWGYRTGARGTEIPIGPDPILAELTASLQGSIFSLNGNHPPFILPTTQPAAPKSCLCAPILVNHRLIGLATFTSAEPDSFSTFDLELIQTLLERLAHSVENAMAFTDLGRYLQQAALMNELATTASVGAGLDEVRRRVVARLRRTFQTEWVAIYLLSPDREWWIEYGEDGSTAPSHRVVKDSLLGAVIEGGAPVRVGNLASDARRALAAAGSGQNGFAAGLSRGGSAQPGAAQAGSALGVPLIFRGRVIGCLEIESSQCNAFSSQDEQLLVVVASHLAVLFENVRLREEAHDYASNLSLIHKVVQRVVGLTDIYQIAQLVADLLGQFFGFEYAVVLVADESSQHLVNLGVGGLHAQPEDRGYAYPIAQGITGKVYRSGVSYFCNDVSLNPDYLSFPGWTGGSEMCVPLRIGDQMFGLLNLERSQINAFNEGDLVIMESLAGVLASVFSNARRYQDLQETIHHLHVARETATDISSDLDLDTLIHRVLERAIELVRARGAILGLVNQEAQRVDIQSKIMPWEVYPLETLPLDRGLTGRIVRSGLPCKVSDYNTWEGRLEDQPAAPFTAVAGVPLKIRGEVLGILLVMDDQPGRDFEDDEVELLELLAPQIAVSIRNARLFQELGERIEAQLQAERRMLHSARLAALGEMAAGVAHELNNPLTTVSGFVELALDELPDELPQRAELALVLSEAQRARGVVRRLLDFARQSENVRLESSLNSLVRDVQALMTHQAQTAGVQVIAELEPDLPNLVVDPNQIKQVLLNLFQNALQAMPQGGQIQLRTGRQRWKGRPGLFFSIRDTGEGISPAHQDRIFEPFFTTRPVGKGTGLGLSVSYGLIADHVGHIDVESKLNEGSCFTVWLPLPDQE